MHVRTCLQGVTVTEQRVREDHFYLGYDKAGALSENAHIQEFMHLTALAIVESALEMAIPPEESDDPSEEEDEGAAASSTEEEEDDDDESDRSKSK